MRLAATGFVSEGSGSVASANALILCELLAQLHTVDFFSKTSFVDPRPVIGTNDRFRCFDVDNVAFDRLRKAGERLPIIGPLLGFIDAWTYNRLIVQRIAEAHHQNPYDVCLWLGDYARGAAPSLQTVSFAQGPPGTDARSIPNRLGEIRRLAGLPAALRWRMLAQIRLSRICTPPLHYSDHIIVGSQQSKQTLQSRYGIPEGRISAIPYPIDLKLFRPESGNLKSESGNCPLRVLWLGRIVPRKRLDLFLDGAALAIQQGCDIRLSIVGGVGFILGYEKLISAFPFPDRLEWVKGIARSEVTDLLRRHDVLAQPSDEENFGSSVAEAQACGLRVIVGKTNGNADYLCSRDIHLRDDHAETFANALREMATRKNNGRLGEASESRNLAADKFDLNRVTGQLVDILESVIRKQQKVGRA